MRAFIAIELPVEIRDGISRIQDKLKAELPKVNWVKPQNLHLSLKFLGDISPEQLYNIKRTTTEIIETNTDFKIELESLGVFPDLHAARIIWIGTNHPCLELKQLGEQLETRLVESGITQEKRTFCAHITIGRIKTYPIASDLKKSIDKVGGVIACANWEFNCREIVLFESTLGSSGPTYTILERFNLKIT
jgi:RNA 2',3'-cyclic 3'-phosphodiesterase